VQPFRIEENFLYAATVTNMAKLVAPDSGDEDVANEFDQYIRLGSKQWAVDTVGAVAGLDTEARDVCISYDVEEDAILRVF
jgi:hypothetical protein